MSVLQTIDLKKYYGTDTSGNVIVHGQELANADRIVRIEDGKIVGLGGDGL